MQTAFGIVQMTSHAIISIVRLSRVLIGCIDDSSPRRHMQFMSENRIDWHSNNGMKYESESGTIHIVLIVECKRIDWCSLYFRIMFESKYCRKSKRSNCVLYQFRYEIEMFDIDEEMVSSIISTHLESSHHGKQMCNRYYRPLVICRFA